MLAVVGDDFIGQQIAKAEMVAVIVSEVVGKQAANVGLAEFGKIQSLNFKRIELYLSRWNMNGVSTYRRSYSEQKRHAERNCEKPGFVHTYSQS